MLQLCPQIQPVAAHAYSTARQDAHCVPVTTTREDHESEKHPWVSGTDTGDEVIKPRDKGQRRGQGEETCKGGRVAQPEYAVDSEMEQHDRRGAQGDRASGVQ